MVEKGASSVGKQVFPIYKYILTYKISSSYFLWFNSSIVLKQTKGVTDRKGTELRKYFM